MRKLCLPIVLISCPALAGPLLLNSSAFDTSRFTVTEYAVSSFPVSMLNLGDGSVAIGTQAGILRYTAPGASPTTLLAGVGVTTGLVQAGGFIIQADSNANAISILKQGATPSDPVSNVGSLQFGFVNGWIHSQMGIAARPTPGLAGSFDIVFNVGSQNNSSLSTDKVGVTGLSTSLLDGDSLYMVTVDLTHPAPIASNLKKVATGIRNVIGMGFQSQTGDFYFLDNAIDGPGAFGDEPPQAEEVNRIPAAQLGVGAPLNFGYPTCYVGYRTGSAVGSGCVQPFFAVQPLPNGTALGSESEGPAQFAFAPKNFPIGFDNGMFIGFAGKGTTGASNEENGVGYLDFPSGNFIHFVENSQNGVYSPIGMMSTDNALYIADFGGGFVYQVTATAPEPMSSAMLAVGLLALALARKHARTSPTNAK